jgi:Ca-activated chloride channel family protein
MATTSISLAHPLWLVAGVVAACAVIALALVAMHRARADALAYSDLAFFETATGARFDPTFPLVVACAGGLVALGASLAGLSVVANLPARGAVVLCVDTSGSMRSADVMPSRAAAAAAAVRAFVDGVPDETRLGIIGFASAAGVVQPLSTEKETVRDAIAQIPPPHGGTAIGDALSAAARLLPSSGRRAIVLITDGVNNLGANPLEVARAIGTLGIEIDTVGIGTNGGGGFVPGTAKEAAIDEDALRAIAGLARGAYARADDAATLRGRLAALAASTTSARRRVDLSLPLALAGGLVVVFAFAGGMLAGRFP